jgi:peptidoglycan/LPS O-acetylase OafA/YrhL
VVLVSANLLRYMGSGPKWPLIDKDFQQPCANYWWSALLYVQNYVNLNDMVNMKNYFFFTLKYFQCLKVSWYLNVDFQLYLISPVLLYPLWKYPQVCLSFLVLCILGFVGVSFYVAWVYNLTAIPTNFYG